MKEVPSIYLGIGSNLGDRAQSLELACKAFEVHKKSSIYETEPVDFLEQPWFLNMVIEIRSNKTPRQLLHYCQSIESQMGRTRKILKGPRTIDIDILFYGNLIVRDPDLIIPHPQIPNRRFVLEPMNEIAPDFLHPVTKKTMTELLAECSDHSRVVPISNPGLIT